MSISELLVALFLLAISLTAFASVIVSSVRSVAHNEREVAATAVGVQVIEELQTLEWDVAHLYDNEVAATSPLPGIDRWRSRLDSGGELEGRELTVTPGYSGSVSLTNPERDERVPAPTDALEREGNTYFVDRYITWADRDDDGTVETKRFTVTTSWVDVDGETRSISTVADRVPTQEEAASTFGGTRVILFAISPDPAELDKDTAEHLLPLKVSVWTNEGVTDGALTVPHLDATDDDILQTSTLTMTPSEAAGAGWARWDTEIAARTYRFWNGQVDLTFTATTTEGTALEGTAALNTFDGPVDEKPGETAPTASPSPSPSPTTSPSPLPPEDVAFISTPTIGSICVSGGSWKLAEDLTITAQVQGLPSSDEEVTVTYPSYSRKTNDDTKPPDEVSTATMVRDPNGSASSADYTLVIPRNTQLFKPGDSVTFRFDARRDRDGQNTQIEVTVPVVTSC